MGWGYGELESGKKAGYNVSATCEEPGCVTKIYRGLAYACGDNHGDDEYSCEGYFCDKHRSTVETQDGDVIGVCRKCEKIGLENGTFVNEDEEE
jgi:hypothetical protein